jgi:hypothetical protein
MGADSLLQGGGQSGPGVLQAADGDLLQGSQAGRLASEEGAVESLGQVHPLGCGGKS